MAVYKAVDTDALDNGLTAVCDAIREKTGTSAPLTFPDGMVEAVKSIGEGRVNPLEYSTTPAKLPDLNVFDTPKIEVHLREATRIDGLFQRTVLNTTVEHIILTCDLPVENVGSVCANTGQEADALKRFTLNADISACTVGTSMFYFNQALEIIDGTPMDIRGMTKAASAFSGCAALREIRFAAACIHAELAFGNSPLSRASIQSVIAGLSDTASGVTLTLKKTAVDTAFETAAGAGDGSTSAEWLALIGTRPAWTITLR